MASSSSLSLSLPSPSLSRNWLYNVFPSFHGPDVRKGFLSHILKEFRIKGIGSFIDTKIERGESIDPEIKRAIKGSKIAIVLLSKNYAASSWCLDELVEIMKCKDFGQTLLTIFYDVDPSDVENQTGDFNEPFGVTCQGKTEEKIETWRKALEDVATIAGYHLKNFDNEAAMIEVIVANISKMLYSSIQSCEFDRCLGLGAHIEKMKPLLRMDLDEVRMIGIWGPPGIGKTTIARFLFHTLSNSFQHSAMVNIQLENYPKPSRHEYYAQVKLQNQMLSQMLNQKDMVINHLRVAPEMLKDKKVLLVIDDVDRLAQLVALAEENGWFGPGSRIIIITEDVRVLRAHRINHIYTVDLPSNDEALQMFCMYAFGQKYPKDGFRELAWEVVCHAGKLPLGLKVMGSYFWEMTKREWKKVLPKLWRSLDGEIESILKFSYNALDYKDKALFLHIACLFVDEDRKHVKNYLTERFPCVSQRLDVLAGKSLISFEDTSVCMHPLLVQLGKEIVREQSPDDPGQRQFLVDSGEISEILADNAAGSENVIGINFDPNGSEVNISDTAFEKMSNLQFLMIRKGDTLHLPHGLSCLSSKFRLLHWDSFPLTCLPSNVNTKFLVELDMQESKLEMLWVEDKPLPNLKWMNLNYSEKLKELPNLSTAVKLKILHLWDCTSLVELPASIENLHELHELGLNGCSKLEVLPVNINLKSLDSLYLSGCSSLKQFPEISTNIRYLYLGGTAIEEVPASIENLHKLYELSLIGCSKLDVFPVNVNLKSLDILYLSDCSSLKQFPEISSNISLLDLNGTAIEELPSSIRSWSRLEKLVMSHCKNLKKFIHDLDSNPERDTKIQEVHPLVQGFSALNELILYKCKNLVSLPQLPDSLRYLNAGDCESLESLDWSQVLNLFAKCNPYKELNFANCFKLNKEAKDLIIQTSNYRAAILPGEEIPTYFTHRGGFLTVKLKERPFRSSLKFKVCILVVTKNGTGDGKVSVECRIIDERINIIAQRFIPDIIDELWPIPKHLYIFELELSDVTTNKLFFEICVSNYVKWAMVKDWGVHFEDSEAVEEENGPNPDTSVIFDTISKYTSNSEAGCSKSKVIDHFGHFSEDSEDDCAETKKRKRQSPSMSMDTKRTSEVGDNRDEEEETEDESLNKKEENERVSIDKEEENESDSIDKEEENESDSIGEEEENESDSKDEEDQENEGDCGDKEEKIGLNADTSGIFETISKYTSNSEVGCSMSKVISLFSEMRLDEVFKASEDDHAETKKRKKQSPFMFMDKKRTSKVGIINGNCEAEEEVKGNDSAETKKRKKQISPFMSMDTKRTSEVGNNGDGEAEEEDDSAKTKKSRVSF